MKHLLWCLGIAAAAQAPAATAQAPQPHQRPHQHQHRYQPQAAQAKPSQAPRASTPAAKASGFQSAFDDYRPLGADEPLKDWRRVNDEVRDAGGHLGILKSQQREKP